MRRGSDWWCSFSYGVEAIHSGRYCILIGGTSVYILSYSSKYSYNMPPRKRQKTAKAAAAEEAAKTKRGPKPVEQVTEAITSNLSDKDLNTIISNVVPAVTQGVLQVLKDLKVIPPENPQNQNFEEEQLPLPTQSSSASVPTPLLAASDRWVDSTVLCLYTDSSNIGFGGYLGNYWFAEEWPKTWYNLHISLKELFPIVLALEFWAPKMQNKCINFFCDNIAVVGLINKQTSRDPNIMCLVRRLVLQCLKKNILFKATHLPGVTNVLADKLSRLQIDDFLEMCKYQPLKRQHVTKDSFTI
ncbi:uncharacterized protein LOC123542500 isoform X8 [Mercenaria mercenaria]|uniref:uncharacterized protein LOC123542500 isoform X8 n=1 Tax=Mercenaria mercenaria TaxID=6596 RepID=UPI00234EFD38|nr:uncharacterized protein LOC123542500 isoform X8 [Mercenaria mercenaria]